MPFKSTTETMKKLHLDYKRETGNQAKSDAGDVEFGSEKAGFSLLHKVYTAYLSFP